MSTGIRLLGASALSDALDSFANEMTDDSAYVGSTAEYAIHVEFGTRYMAARPFLRPSLKKGLKPQRIQQVLEGVLSGQIDNKAYQIAQDVADIATKNMGGSSPAPPGDYPAQPTGNLAGSVKAGATLPELRSESEAAQSK